MRIGATSLRLIPVALPFTAALSLGLLNLRALLAGWLAALCLAIGVPFGCLLLVAVMRLVPGRWRILMGRQAVCGLSLFPFVLPTAVPILSGAVWLYPWAGKNDLQAFKAVYLTPLFFGLRGFLILVLFIALGLALKTGGKRLAVIALMAFVVLDGVVAVDWLMSLDTDFHSSGFALYVLALQVLTAFSFIVMTTKPQPAAHDTRLFGALFLSLQLLWPYFAFMQYFIIWSDNLPRLAQWYLTRAAVPWSMVAEAFSGLHLLALFALIFPPVRRDIGLLRLIAAATLLANGLEYLWLVLPALPSGGAIAFAAFIFSLLGMVQVAGGTR